MKLGDRKAVAGLTVMVVFALLILGNSVRELTGIYFASASGAGAVAGLERAFSLTPSNWRYAHQLAGVSKAVGRHESAVHYYGLAIDAFEGCGPCWIGLAEALSALGRDPTQALDGARHYGRSQTGVRTRAAVVLSRLDDVDAAAEEFSAALGGHRKDRRQFHGLLHRVYPAEFVLGRIVTDADLPSYFSFALEALGPEDTARIWSRYSSMETSRVHRQPYVGYLLKHGRVHDAWHVAFDAPAPLQGPVVNAGFEAYGDAGHFDWTVERGEGVRARVSPCSDCSPGRRALRLTFDGEHNVHYFGVRQYVPVQPGGSYRLKARVKYDELSSARGPGIFVDGARDLSRSDGGGCRLWVVGEQFTGSSSWTDTELEFTVPAECDGIRILVGRPGTRRLDRFVGGDFWVDDLSLEAIENLPGNSLQEIAGRVAG